MLASWVLIVVIFGASPSGGSAYFATKDMCEAARMDVFKDITAPTTDTHGVAWTPFSARCELMGPGQVKP